MLGTAFQICLKGSNTLKKCLSDARFTTEIGRLVPDGIEPVCQLRLPTLAMAWGACLI